MSGSDPAATHWSAYPRFLVRMLSVATDGKLPFYAWMTVLTGVALVGANAWAHQVAQGMGVTAMTDHVSWGLYIANFTFAVGIAAGGVMMVIPAYLYDNRELHDVVIFGELLAIAAIIVCLAFVGVDVGRPDRFWHMIPGMGRFNWPVSMLTWDVVVLSIYLLLNLHICGYLLYHRYTGKPIRRRWYLPFVMISILWAISIHTVTAFLYAGLGGRPFWNSALLAPRFLASAFVSGPALIAIMLLAVRRLTAIKVADGALKALVAILRITVIVNLFMLLSEVFVEFYTGGAHTASAEYLFFGLGENTDLVPWMWTSVAFNVIGAVLLFKSDIHDTSKALIVACVLSIIGIWIEKGMGLIVPGFVPSTLHEIVGYSPSMVEWKISAGIWALGAMVLTVAAKCAAYVMGRPQQ